MPATVTTTPDGVAVTGDTGPGFDEILTHDALAFVADLHRTFNQRRLQLLKAREERQTHFDAGRLPGFLDETREVREGGWSIASIPDALQDRRVEITGPVERKMMVNALNSGAKVFMADFEDSNSPTWKNCIEGQLNARDAVRGELDFTHPDTGKEYTVGDEPALLILRVRGWHLDEAHVTVDGEPVSGGLFDFAVSFYHTAKKRLENGEGPYYYLPKLEHHLEARLWNDIFVHAQDKLGIPHGSVKTTILVETLPAVFQMDEILYELRDHICGLNAGRWDYIFSCIKVCRNDKSRVLPDRGQLTMTVPFMRAYTELLVKTCHKRGAFAMGGMSAFIPDRRDPEVTKNALLQVRGDKQREADDGCDGTWVAHPDLVEVAMEIFDDRLGKRPNQLDKQRGDVAVTAEDLLDFTVPDGKVTMQGLQGNIDVGLRYIEAWLSGIGAAAIHNLMEDAATAEISRSQIWQWVHHSVELDDGTTITRELVQRILDETAATLAKQRDKSHFDLAARLFADVALAEDYPAFLTLPAYQKLNEVHQ